VRCSVSFQAGPADGQPRGHPGGSRSRTTVPGQIRQVVGQGWWAADQLAGQIDHITPEPPMVTRQRAARSELSLVAGLVFRSSSTMPTRNRCFTHHFEHAEALLAHVDRWLLRSSSLRLNIAGSRRKQQKRWPFSFPGGPSAHPETPIGFQNRAQHHPAVAGSKMCRGQYLPAGQTPHPAGGRGGVPDGQNRVTKASCVVAKEGEGS